MSDEVVAIFALSDLPLPVEQLRSGAVHPQAGAFATPVNVDAIVFGVVLHHGAEIF